MRQPRMSLPNSSSSLTSIAPPSGPLALDEAGISRPRDQVNLDLLMLVAAAVADPWRPCARPA